jgi:hypothetical protein
MQRASLPCPACSAAAACETASRVRGEEGSDVTCPQSSHYFVSPSKDDRRTRGGHHRQLALCTRHIRTNQQMKA